MGLYAHVVREIKEMEGDFEELSFAHERRRSNKEAHTLARNSVLLEEGRHVWLLEPRMVYVSR
jgi:hypothetical protein